MFSLADVALVPPLTASLEARWACSRTSATRCSRPGRRASSSARRTSLPRRKSRCASASDRQALGPGRRRRARGSTGAAARFDLDGRRIAVFWDGATWTAVDDTCPHMGASLADGRLYGDELQCSWHDWRYNRTTGQCPVREWARVRVHPVRIEDGGVWLERPEPAPTPPEPSDGESGMARLGAGEVLQEAAGFRLTSAFFAVP